MEVIEPAMREDSESGDWYHRNDVDALQLSPAQAQARDDMLAYIGRLELSAQQSAHERDCAVERVAGMEKALREAMEWNWLDEDSPPPQEVIDQCNKSLMVRVTK